MSLRCSGIFNSAWFLFPKQFLETFPFHDSSSSAPGPEIRLKPRLTWRPVFSTSDPATSTFQRHSLAWTVIYSNQNPLQTEQEQTRNRESMKRNTAGAKKIALSAVKTLTFYADKYTAGRRTNPIREPPPRERYKSIRGLSVSLAQLTCQGPGCKVFQPDVVQCTNMGDDGLGNVQWKVCFGPGG